MQPVPVLGAQQACALTMSQEQAACLLANAFLCTWSFPRCAQPEQIRALTLTQPHTHTPSSSSSAASSTAGIAASHPGLDQSTPGTARTRSATAGTAASTPAALATASTGTVGTGGHEVTQQSKQWKAISDDLFQNFNFLTYVLFLISLKSIILTFRIRF